MDRPGATFCRFCGAPQPGATASNGAPPAVAPGVGAVGPAVAGQPAARLVLIQQDGSEGQVIALDEPQVDIGRSEGQVVLGEDPYLSSRHARIERRVATEGPSQGGDFVLTDLGSCNGVYVRLRQSFTLSHRAMILIGQQVLRFEVVPEAERRLGSATQHGVMVFGTPEAPRLARLVQQTNRGVARDVYHLYREETILGRENADIVFPDDPYISRRHASIRIDADEHFVLRDLGSSNGTFLRMTGEHVLRDGDQVRLGRHVFRFDSGRAGQGGRRAQ